MGPLAAVRRSDGRFGAREATRVWEAGRGGEEEEDEDACLEEEARYLLDECELCGGGVLDS